MCHTYIPNCETAQVRIRIRLQNEDTTRLAVCQPVLQKFAIHNVLDPILRA